MLRCNNHAGEGRVPKALILAPEYEKDMKIGTHVGRAQRRIGAAPHRICAHRPLTARAIGVLGLPAHRGAERLLAEPRRKRLRGEAEREVDQPQPVAALETIATLARTAIATRIQNVRCV